jgi:hypothetical protein
MCKPRTAVSRHTGELGQAAGLDLGKRMKGDRHRKRRHDDPDDSKAEQLGA